MQQRLQLASLQWQRAARLCAREVPYPARTGHRKGAAAAVACLAMGRRRKPAERVSPGATTTTTTRIPRTGQGKATQALHTCQRECEPWQPGFLSAVAAMSGAEAAPPPPTTTTK